MTMQGFFLAIVRLFYWLHFLSVCDSFLPTIILHLAACRRCHDRVVSYYHARLFPRDCKIIYWQHFLSVCDSFSLPILILHLWSRGCSGNAILSDPRAQRGIDLRNHLRYAVLFRCRLNFFIVRYHHYQFDPQQIYPDLCLVL